MRTTMVVLVLLAGCARVRMVGFDNRDHSMTFCGNNWASGQDLYSAAVNACRSNRASLVGCGRQAVASKTSYQRSWGSGEVTGATTTPVTQACCTYQCQ